MAASTPQYSLSPSTHALLNDLLQSRALRQLASSASSTTLPSPRPPLSSSTRAHPLRASPSSPSVPLSASASAHARRRRASAASSLLTSSAKSSAIAATLSGSNPSSGASTPRPEAAGGGGGGGGGGAAAVTSPANLHRIVFTLRDQLAHRDVVIHELTTKLERYRAQLHEARRQLDDAHVHAEQTRVQLEERLAAEAQAHRAQIRHLRQSLEERQAESQQSMADQAKALQSLKMEVVSTKAELRKLASAGSDSPSRSPGSARRATKPASRGARRVGAPPQLSRPLSTPSVDSETAEELKQLLDQESD